jgi:hypothetical protein
MELMEWPALLVEGFQACDVVERERNLPAARRRQPPAV